MDAFFACRYHLPMYHSINWSRKNAYFPHDPTTTKPFKSCDLSYNTIPHTTSFALHPVSNISRLFNYSKHNYTTSTPFSFPNPNHTTTWISTCDENPPNTLSFSSKKNFDAQKLFATISLAFYTSDMSTDLFPMCTFKDFPDESPDIIATNNSSFLPTIIIDHEFYTKAFFISKHSYSTVSLFLKHFSFF